MTNQEIALAVFVTEVEAGLHTGLTFDQWFAAKAEVQEVEVEQTEEKINDLSLLNGLGAEFKIGAVMRLQHFLRNAKLGTVTNHNLRVGNKGDLVGEVYGTKCSVSLTQHVYLTPKGQQAWRMKVSQF